MFYTSSIPEQQCYEICAVTGFGELNRFVTQMLRKVKLDIVRHGAFLQTKRSSANLRVN